MAELTAGTQVELRPGYEEVYQRAWAASRGTIGDVRTDPDGFEQVYIIWDKNHWRYNGEKDCWTFAEHFRPVDGPDNRELVPANPQQTSMAIPTEEDSEERTEHYLNVLMAACDKAAESEGFFMITLKQDDVNNGIRLEILGATTNEDLENLPTDALFRYVEQEMRRRRTGE